MRTLVDRFGDREDALEAGLALGVDRRSPQQEAELQGPHPVLTGEGEGCGGALGVARQG